jgi:SAM-dependent methyltransferase
MNKEKSYVLGTHDSEIARLGVQHRVWRSAVLDLWRDAGIEQDMSVMDCGAGPGYATLDLAEIVGPRGRVVAVERSRRFLDALRVAAQSRGQVNVETVEADLLEYDWPRAEMDRLWCRWVLAFVADPAKVVQGIAHTLKPGGKAIFHEYYDYGSWHLAPPSAAFDVYVAKIIARWRFSGGEPDIGLALPSMLNDAGLEVELIRPVVFTARMADFASRWPHDFAREQIPVMLADGDLSPNEAEQMNALLDACASDPNSFHVTPGVLHLVARRPS